MSSGRGSRLNGEYPSNSMQSVTEATLDRPSLLKIFATVRKGFNMACFTCREQCIAIVVDLGREGCHLGALQCIRDPCVKPVLKKHRQGTHWFWYL